MASPVMPAAPLNSFNGASPHFKILLQNLSPFEKQMASTSTSSFHEEGLVIDEASQVSVIPLDPAELSFLLSRLPEAVNAYNGDDAENESEHSVHLRYPSLAPPPKSGMLSPIPFPPPSEERPEQPFDLSTLPCVAGDAGEELVGEEVPPQLRITHFTPTVDFVEHVLASVSLTFSQPMVALSSIANVEADTASLAISLMPPVDGTWRWLDTQTIQFEAKHRLPFSTEFTLSVAQSCKSSVAGALSSPFSHTFSTSPPAIVHWSPSHMPKSLSPLFLLCFNQRISPPSILSHIFLAEEGDPSGAKFTAQDLETVDDESAAKDEWPEIIKDEVKGMWVAFRLKEKLLKRATSYALCVPSGCPSAEGDFTSKEDWSASFSTYGPLVIASSYEHPYGRKQWCLVFSHHLNHASVSKSAIHISPSIEDYKVTHTEGSSVISLHPVIKSAATYLVTVNTSIKDTYGQHLDESKATAEFKSAPDQFLECFLAGPSKMVVLNPSTLSDPFIPLSVLNFSSLYIQVFQVEVDDFNSPELPFSTESNYAEHKTCAVGKRVHEQEVELQVESDEPIQHKVLLGSFLQHPDEHYGQLLVIAEPTKRAWMQSQGLSDSYKFRDVVCVWVQCTQLTVDVFSDRVNGVYVAWVSSLESGAPISKATVSVGSHKQGTDDFGLAVIEHQGACEKETISVQKGKDITFMPSIRIGRPDGEIYGWYVFDSRGLYKPTEEVHIKGYVRKLERKRGGGQQPVFVRGHIRYEVHDAHRNKLAEGVVTLNEYGTFFFTFCVPDNANLGKARIRIEYEGEQAEKSSHQHTVKIQEFRKPEFEVKTTHWAPSTLYAHSSKSSFVIASTSADYYAGGPLDRAHVLWIIQPTQTHYAPPGHMQYTFSSHAGFFPGRWRHFGRRDPTMSYPSYELTGETDMDGKHDIKIQFKGIENCPSSISVSATSHVTDMNNQVQSAGTTFILHPSFLFVGFKLKETFGRKGEEVRGEVIVCNVDGKLVQGMRVKVTITGQGKQEEEDAAGLLVNVDVFDEQEISIDSEEKPVDFSFIPRLGGIYNMVFRVIDTEQRPNESRCNGFYVSGGFIAAPRRTTSDFIPQEGAQIIPNKDIYEAGERAVLLVQSPFWPAEGLLIMKHWDAHVGEKVQFHMQNNTHTVTVCLDASWVPTVEVQMLLVGSVPFTKSDGATDAKQILRPAFATAKSSISISSSYHKLAVHITPMRAEEAATPGGVVHVSVKVKEERSGEVAGNAEISLLVVDEAILNLAGYTLSEPLSSFYNARHGYSLQYHLRKYCLMPDFHPRRKLVGSLQNRMARHAMALSSNTASRLPAGDINTIRTRSDFDPLAAFVPHCITDAKGFTEVRVQLPDNLTRYRIWVVASTETQFGLAESTLTVQLPVMLRPSPPRFLNLLDKALISVVVQNQTNLSLPLLVGMRRNNAKVEAESVGYSLTLPRSQRVVISFSVLAVDVGKACLQVVARTPAAREDVPSFSDACDIIIPIFTPVSKEHVATYSNVAEKDIILQPIKSPLDVFPRYGSLDISISSTALQSLTDALLYLHSYPFECNEQLASRIIGFLSLWEVLQAFRVTELPSKEKLTSKLKSDLQMLKDRQLSCGGWSWWTPEGNPEHQPFISLHVACALVKASKLEILGVDNEMLEKALGYCADIECHVMNGTQASRYLKETQHALLAYALYIQTLSNKDVGAAASCLLEKASLAQLSLEACGWMLVALGLAEKKNSDDIKILLDHVKSRVVETGEYAHFTTSYENDGMSVMLHSNSRTDSILLEALLVTEASSSLCVKLAKGLQAHRRAGHWSSTQDNCFSLVALNRFFAVYEREEPNLTANIWMGEQWVMSHTYFGRTIETKHVKVPMAALLLETKEKETTQLVVQKKGKGRLYFRIGLEYASRDLQQKAGSYGFSVMRTYEGVDSPLHAVHDTAAKTWKFKAGEKVRVKLTMGTMSIRYHVALVDFLPAGCEPINPALERLVAREQESCMQVWSWRSGWMEHVNMRDERVEAFCTRLRPGLYEYSYVVRATCRGDFTIPSAKVEEMYSPENFGRCASERCIIE